MSGAQDGAGAQALSSRTGCGAVNGRFTVVRGSWAMMIRHGVRHLLLALAGAATALAAAPDAAAQACDTPSGLPVPRFVTLKFSEVRGRTGPSVNHAVRWDYARAGLPMEVVAETADWRRVRDPQGEETWMHRRTLSGRRGVEVREPMELHARPDLNAPVTARAEPGAILWLERCRTGWCRLESDGVRGWAEAETLWGVYAWELASGPGALEAADQPCYRSASGEEGELIPASGAR
jgi:SH3-like domain-containing protein